MKLPLLAAMAALSTFAAADRFILAPLGQKLPYGTLKFEHLFQGGSIERYDDFLGFGLTTAIDGELVRVHRPGRSDRYSLNLAYNVVGPVVELLPGVSIGVQDAMNDTPDGRRFYWVTTYHIGLEGRFNSRTPMEFTLGGSVGSRTGAIFCVSMPFTPWFKLLAEYDTGRITHGMEYKPAKPAAVRMLFRDKQVFWSLSWLHKF